MDKLHRIIDLISQDDFLDSVSRITGKSRDFVERKILNKYEDPSFVYDINHVISHDVDDLYYKVLGIVAKHVNS
ncbi:MAG: hypothetical protein QXS19_09020 [Candidatus Methanomethylicia archaeon]